MEEKGIDAALDFLAEVVAAMHLSADVEAVPQDDGAWLVEFVGQDAGGLVGRQGSTLNALQYLAGIVAQRQAGQQVRLILDADGYREKRREVLVEQAMELAREVIEARQEAELDPLSPYERRIIHMALADHPDVVTYSEGTGDERRIIIAPRPESAAPAA